jgi:hypothetical protein
MKIEFLQMHGCPNISEMWQSLQSAINDLKLHPQINILDLDELSDQQDTRAGFGSPSILVNGNDLFGAALPSTYHPSCRFYPKGLPDKNEIIIKLKFLLE